MAKIILIILNKVKAFSTTISLTLSSSTTSSKDTSSILEFLLT